MLEAEMQISYATQNPARPLLYIQKKSGGAILLEAGSINW